MTEFVYNNVKGEVFNKLPMSDQLSILKTFYPIGAMFQYNEEELARFDAYKKCTCCIIDHIIHRSYNASWYILKIKNIGDELIKVRGKEVEEIHPGFLMPTKQFLRNLKLDQIGI